MVNTTSTTSSSPVQEESVVGETFSLVAPIISGCTSVASSALIIFIIFKSRQKLSTVYHRLLFGMSCFDILGSLAVVLTTLPMPRTLPPELIDYGWAGIRIGTVETCAAQGFAYNFGIIAMYGYNVTLTVYYALVIAFRMRDDRIAKYLEPFFLHLFPILVGLGIAVPPLFFIEQDDMVYKPSLNMWCSIAPSSSFRSDTASSQAEDGDEEEELFVNKYYDLQSGIIISSYLSIIFISFVLMVCRVYHTERHFTRIHRSSAIRVNAQTENTHKNTKVLLVQILAYTLALLLTLLFPLIRVSIPNEPDWVLRGMFTLTPLQGFFNLLIFIFHKVYNYRRVYDDVSMCCVIGLLLKGDAQEFVLFSRISALNYDTDRRVMELELIDETNHAGYYSIKEDDGSQQPAGSAIEAMVGENEEENDNLDDFLDYMLSLSKKSKVDQEESCGSVSTKLGKLVTVESLSSDQISILKSEGEERSTSESTHK